MAPPIYARGIARIVALTETGEKHVGMAIVVDDQHVMTCCHVLNDALNAVRSERRDRLDPTHPPEGTRFEVRFPFAAKAKRDGGVVGWGLELESPKDVAVLELKLKAPAEADGAEFSRADVPLNKAWLCNGWSTEGTERGAGGTFGPILSNGELQLNGLSGLAVRIAEGYSGAGVWSGDLGAFVGMVVTKDIDQFENATAYAIPTNALLGVWPGLQRITIGPSSLQEELKAYLAALKIRVNHPPGSDREASRLEGVRIPVRVRVSAERQEFDPALAKERELRHRQGFIDDNRSGGGKGGTTPGETPRVKVLDWDRDVREKFHRVVLVGDPGLGKTWLLSREATRLADEAARRLHESPDVSGILLPIHCRLTDVAEALITLIEKHKRIAGAPLPALPDAVIEALRGRHLPSADGSASKPPSERLLAMLQSRVGTENAVLLLDAFDEVPDDRREPLRRALSEWVPLNPRARLLFTSRVVGYKQPWPIPDRSDTEREMELLPFADDQMAAFVSAYFAGETETGRGFHELLRRVPQVRGMAQVPLLLKFLCALYLKNRGEPADERLDFARLRRTDLYRDVLRGLLAGQWRGQSEDAVDAKLRLLKPVAFRLFLAGMEQFRRPELENALSSAYAEVYSGQVLAEADLARRIQEWTIEDGIFVRAGHDDDAPFRFLHLTFQEYLAARHVAERINANGWDRTVLEFDTRGQTAPAQVFVDRKAWLPDWREVIVLLAGNLDDPVPLLELLSDGARDDAFRHRLALAALCLPEMEGLPDGPTGSASGGDRSLSPLQAPGTKTRPRLQQLRDQITTKLFAYWFCHAMAKTRAAVRHLDAALGAAGRAGGRLAERWLPPSASLLVESQSLAVVRQAFRDIWGNLSLARCLTYLLRKLDHEARSLVTQALVGPGAMLVTPELLAALIELLHDSDWNVRYAGAEALGSLGGAAATDDVLTALIQLLHDPELLVRFEATRGFGHLGQAAATPEVLTALVHLLRGSDQEMRSAMVNRGSDEEMRSAMVNLRGAALDNTYANDWYRSLWSEVVKTVGALGAAATPQVVTALVQLLRDPEWLVRTQATHALRELGAAAATPEVVAALVPLLSDPEWFVREIALRAVGAMGAAAATPDIVAALAQLLFDPEESVRIEAIRALKDLGAAAVPRALAVLVPLLRDPDAFRWSAYTLSRLGPAAATPEVLTALAGLLRDCDESVRSTAAEAVGELGPAAATDEVLTALVPLLHQPTKPMRYVGESGTMPGVLAVYHLGAAAATRDVLTALTQRLFDDVASGRSWAAMAVGRLGKSAATREVLAALVQLLHDPVTDVRSSAAWALGALGAPAAKPEVLTALIQLLRDPEIFVWAKAADALSSLLERATPEVLDALIEQVLDALIELGRSDDAAKQATAIRTLHNLGAVISFAPAQSKVLTALLRLRRNAATWEWSRAVGALGVLGAATRPEALDTLVQSLRDPSSTVRSKAAEAIDTIMHQEVRLFLRGRWFFPTQVTPRSLGELAER